MSLFLFGALAYLAFGALFLLGWTRGLPPPENSSRIIARFEQQRALTHVLPIAFRPPERNAPFAPLLKKLDRI